MAYPHDHLGSDEYYDGGRFEEPDETTDDDCFPGHEACDEADDEPEARTADVAAVRALAAGNASAVDLSNGATVRRGAI